LVSKKITVMFLSEEARKVRQLKFPKYLLTLLLIVTLSGGAFLFYGIHHYLTVKSELPEIVSLREENRQQKVQLLALSKKIQEITVEMKELRDLDQKLKVMANIENGEKGEQLAGIGGSDASLQFADVSMEKAHETLVRLLHKSLDGLEDEVEIRKKEKIELYDYLKNQKAMLSCTPSIWPAKGWISSGFGSRTSPFTNHKEFHKGVDICNRKGTAVVAPADGIVASVGTNHGYGKMLTITHGYGLKTVYAHLDKILVKKGGHVKRGQKIAIMGDSGRTTGPHLHYEVHVKNVPVNPKNYFLN